MEPLTVEEANFIGLSLKVFLKNFEIIEMFLGGVDLSDAKVQALSILKKLRPAQAPKPPELPKTEVKPDGQ